MDTAIIDQHGLLVPNFGHQHVHVAADKRIHVAHSDPSLVINKTDLRIDAEVVYAFDNHPVALRNILHPGASGSKRIARAVSGAYMADHLRLTVDDLGFAVLLQLEGRKSPTLRGGKKFAVRKPLILHLRTCEKKFSGWGT
jgi:hypothetical protein